MQLAVVGLQKKHSFSEVSNVKLMLSRKSGYFILNRSLRFGQEGSRREGRDTKIYQHTFHIRIVYFTFFDVCMLSACQQVYLLSAVQQVEDSGFIVLRLTVSDLHQG